MVPEKKIKVCFQEEENWKFPRTLLILLWQVDPKDQKLDPQRRIEVIRHLGKLAC